MEKLSLKQKADVQVHAKFFVQKSGFFGLSKRLLVIHKTGILIQTIPKEESQQETISFNDLSVIEAPARNVKEILIGTKKNGALSLFCSDRIKCICEIYYVWDIYILSKSPRLEKAFPTYEISKQIIPNNYDLFLEVQLTIFRTHIEINHKNISTQNKNQTFIQIENSESGFSSSLSFSFCLIKTIQKTHSGLIFILKDSLVKHRFLFHDIEKVNNLISKIQTNCQEYLDSLRNIPVEDINEEIIQSVNIFKSNNPFLFETKLYKLLESGHLYQIKVSITDDYIVEVDLITNFIMQKYDIKYVEDVVQMASGVPAICIVFTNNTIVSYIPEEHERDLISSNFFTLINWRKPNNDAYRSQSDFIHCAIPHKNYKVQCWLNEDVDPEYERDLVKSIVNSKDEEEVSNLLQEFNMNAILKNYNNNDFKPLQFLIKPFIKYVKLIKTKQFLKYWDSLQADLTATYKPSSRRKSIVLEKQERFKSFGNYEADEQFSIQLNIQPFITILTKTEEILKALILLISAKPFYKEISTNKKDIALFEDFLKEVISLIETPYPTLNHLSGSFLRALCRSPSATEKKTEASNKRFLLTNKIGLLLTISKSLARQVLIKKENTVSHSNFDNLPVHSVLASLRILKTFLYDRKETTEEGDLQIIQRLVSCAYYFCICNFLARSNSIACVYNSTIILSTSFRNCVNRQLYKKLQSRFLDNSTLIPLNIIFVFSSPLIPQRKLSMSLLAHVFFANEEACTWLLQVFPKYLFTKVDSEATYITDWSLQQWEQFFSILVQNFNTPTEQWDEECRRELLKKLKETDIEVTSVLERCPASKMQELVDPTFKNDGEFLLNIRWNHEEFDIQYQTLLNKILVWKYFLTSFIQDTENPVLTIKISNPSKFWSELHIKFITENNNYERKKVLKTMILLYKTYTEEIKELSTIPFWLKNINKEDFSSLRYLVLQLLYTCMTIENNKVAQKNLFRFMDSNGFEILTDILTGCYFRENHDEMTTNDYNKLKKSALPDVDYNYTNLEIPRQAYTPSLRQAICIFLILQIFKVALMQPGKKLSLMGDQSVIPIPKAKQQLSHPKILNSLINILLLEDDGLVLELLHLLYAYFMDKSSLDVLINNTPLFDFLLVNVNLKTAPTRFNLLLKIYHRIADQLPVEDNPIKIYTDFSFIPVPNEITNKALKLFPPLKYLPKHLIWKLINSGVNELIRIFFSPYYEAPELIWTEQMKEKIIKNINLQIKPYKNIITAYSESHEVHSKKDLEEYQSDLSHLEFQFTPEEVMCGPIILKVWSKKAFRAFELSPKEVLSFVQTLYSLLKETMKKPLGEMNQKEMEDTLVIVKSHAKAIKLYSLKDYACFQQIIALLKYFADQMGELEKENFSNVNEFLLVLSFLIELYKIISRTIHLNRSENIKTFIDAGGFPLLISIQNSMINKINMTKENETDNYSSLKVSYQDLKVINLSIKILKEIVIKNPSVWESIDSDSKLQIFLDFQIASKISLLFFEFIKNQFEKSEYQEKTDDSFEDNSANSDNSNPHIISIFYILHSEGNINKSNLYTDKLIDFTNHLFELLISLSCQVSFCPLLIQSGIVWRCIELLTYFDDPNRYSRKIENPIYRKTVTSIEMICNVLRNVLIFSNEAYILKTNSSLVKSKEVGIKTKKIKSQELLPSLDKLGGFERTVLAKFQTAIFHLIGQSITQVLLMDYYEPVLIPKGEDRDNILRFMKIFATSYSDPLTLWNYETKQELKELIMSQIIMINNSNGKSFFNLVESFEYKCYLKELIIDKIFVSSFSHYPDYKVPNPKKFILKALEETTIRWQLIQESKLISDEIDKSSEQMFHYGKLNDVIACIFNIISSDGCEETILFETNMTLLGQLLNDQVEKGNRILKIQNIKRNVLSILSHLSKNLNGAVKIMENVSILRSIYSILRENSQECEVLSLEVIVQILENISKFENLVPLLINYGLFYVLLELCLKTEIYNKQIRLKILCFFQSISKVNKELSNSILEKIFPQKLGKVIDADHLSLEDTLNLLDFGSERPTTFWTLLMRHEVLLYLDEINTIIQAKWNQQRSKEVKIIENLSLWTEGLKDIASPKFPDLFNNICIEGIYLKNLNKNPNFDDQKNLHDFIVHLVKYGENLNQILNENVLSRLRKELISRTEEKQDRLHREMIVVLTAVLFLIDWLVYKSKEIEGIKKEKVLISAIQQEDKISEEEGDSKKFDESKIADILITFILESLKFTTHQIIGHHLLTTQVQICYVLLDYDKGYTALQNIRIVEIVTKLIEKIVRSQTNFIEEKLILHLLLKLLYRDQSLIPIIIKSSIDDLKIIYMRKKEYLGTIIEDILTLIAKDPDHGRQAFLSFNKEKDLISVSTIHDCSPAKTIAEFWKSPARGWNCFKSGSLLNLMLTKPKESPIQCPIISEYSVESLFDLNEEEKNISEDFEQYLSKIRKQYSNSKY